MLLSALCPIAGMAQPAVVLHEAQDTYPLGLLLEYLEDPTQTLTIADVVAEAFAGRFRRSHAAVPNFGYTAAAYWVRLRVLNPARQTTAWRLELGFANMQQIDYYRPRADQPGFDVIRTGTSQPFATREFPYHRFAFVLTLPPDAEQTIYLRFQNEGSMLFPLTIWAPDAFIRHQQHEFFLTGLFYGALLLLIAYNTFFWLALRERAYGYFVSFLLVVIVGQLAYEGLAGQYLWPDAPRWTKIVIILFWAGVSILIQMFSITFLDTRTRAPRIHRALIGFLTIWLLVLLCVPFVNFRVLMRVTMPLRLLNAVLFTGINYRLWRRGYQPARYAFLAWLMSALPVILFALSRLGAIPSTTVTEQSYRVGVVLTGLLFSFALADRIHILQQEKDAAQRQAVAALQDKERMIEEQKSVLERHVTERTRALQQEIYARQQTQVELQRAKEHAEAANRAKSLFLSNMSHELRTPLNAILGYAQLLKPGTTTGSLEATGLETIERSGRHLVQLIEDLLDLAKIEAQKIDLVAGVFSLPACLTALSNMIRLRADQKGLIFEYNPPPDVPYMVIGDEKRLSQVLLNVLGNAVKFTEQGRVTLRVTRMAAGSDSPDSAEVQHERRVTLRFAVDDTGPGIPADQWERIFAPFAQIRDAGKHAEGAGLGLAISRSLARLMGDDLHVASIVGQGSAFWFTLTLPDVSASYAPSQIESWQIVGVRGTPPRMLIVDDHADNRAMLRQMLQPLGFVIAEAENGQEGLEIAERERPDLVLMDLMMPVLDGFEATRRMRHSPALAAVKIVIITANATINAAALISEIGCDAVLTKPLRLDHLLDQIQTLLGLEWVTADSAAPLPDERPLVLPPAAELDKLRSLADICALTELIKEITRLCKQDARYEPFAANLRPLINTFQFAEILKRLEPARNGI